MAEDEPSLLQRETTKPSENNTPDRRQQRFDVEVKIKELPLAQRRFPGPYPPAPSKDSEFWNRVEQLRVFNFPMVVQEWIPDTDLDLENYHRRLKNRFTWELARLVNSELPAGQRRVVFTVGDIYCRSLDFKLFIENVDSLLDFIGNNADLIEAVLAHHIPPAFALAYGVSETAVRAVFDVAVTVPPALTAYAAARLASPPAATPPPPSATEPSPALDAKAKARFILQRIMASTLLLPVLIIMPRRRNLWVTASVSERSR